MDGIAKAKDRGAKFGRKRELTDVKAKEIRTLRESGDTVLAIIKRTKASVYRAPAMWCDRWNSGPEIAFRSSRRWRSRS
jgi:DNA invertase Pin-like site-specific DNA recombinase